MRLRDGIAVFQRDEHTRQLGCGPHAVELRGLTPEQVQLLDALGNGPHPSASLTPKMVAIGSEQRRQLGQVLNAVGALSYEDDLGGSDEECRLYRRDGHSEALKARRASRLQLRVFACADPFQLLKMRPYLRAVVNRLFNYGFTHIGLDYQGRDYPARLRGDLGAEIDARLRKVKSPHQIVAVFPRRLRGTHLIETYREGIDHLVVVLDDREIQIGPYVRVHHGPCGHCLDLHERDLDRAATDLASQASFHSLPTFPADLTELAAMHTARAVADEVDHRGWASGEARYCDEDLLVERFQWPSHNRCPHHQPPSLSPLPAGNPRG